jgi:uncharacterized membrane protein YkvA (DUF1232 family)
MQGPWAFLIILANRLPPGVLLDLAAFIPDCVTTVRRLRKDPRVPRRAKIAMVIAGLWVASPIDLIPEFVPVIGPLDDIVVALRLRYAGRQAGAEHSRELSVAARTGLPACRRGAGVAAVGPGGEAGVSGAGGRWLFAYDVADVGSGAVEDVRRADRPAARHAYAAAGRRSASGLDRERGTATRALTNLFLTAGQVVPQMITAVACVNAQAGDGGERLRTLH